LARNIEAVCKQCRRQKTKLFLKGEKCWTDKCVLDRKPFAPGLHGKKPRKVSEYDLQLREKQKARWVYGVLEKQFRSYYDLAVKSKGITGEKLLQILESRLDNVVYRLGFAFSRNEARQFVRHGHFEVNGRRVDIPSYRVKPGDVIAVREKSKELARIKEALESSYKPEVPSWLEIDDKNLVGKILRLPTLEEIDLPVQEQLIIGLYSK